jgi:hypothetical protein
MVNVSPVDSSYFHSLIARALGAAGIEVDYTQRVG